MQASSPAAEADRAATLKTTVKVSNYRPGHPVHRRLCERAAPRPRRQGRPVDRGRDHHRPQTPGGGRALRAPPASSARAPSSMSARRPLVTMDGLGRSRPWSAAAPMSRVSSTAPPRPAPARLGLQALRLPYRHRAGRTPDSIEIDEPVRSATGRRRTTPAVSRPRQPHPRPGAVAQHRGRQGGAGGRDRKRRRHRQRLGILSPLQANASIALGTSEVTLLELAQRPCPLRQWRLCRSSRMSSSRITTRDGKVLYERHGGGLGKVIGTLELGA